MEIPRGSVIVSRCSLKYIKDQTSCERGKSEIECKGGKVLPFFFFISLKWKTKKKWGFDMSSGSVLFWNKALVGDAKSAD